MGLKPPTSRLRVPHLTSKQPRLVCLIVMKLIIVKAHQTQLNTKLHLFSHSHQSHRAHQTPNSISSPTLIVSIKHQTPSLLPLSSCPSNSSYSPFVWPATSFVLLCSRCDPNRTSPIPTHNNHLLRQPYL
uniref:Uncharacterized protein n=1 Tax=Cacopsylla melanoneura TaxID=428564 RepID=A0A8D8TG91_9HEMI